MNHSKDGRLWGMVLAGGEDTGVREFLSRHCRGRESTQLCGTTGGRSLLKQTLARVERLIPRERILVVVSFDHRADTAQHLVHWPAENVLFQPANRGTAPGILLPLAHISHRDVKATVAVFPADQVVLEEDYFMCALRRAIAEVQRFPRELLLLGTTPVQTGEGYSWIEPAGKEVGRASRAVCRFWQEPSFMETQALLARGALWNTSIFIVQAVTLWTLFRQAVPSLCDTFRTIHLLLPVSHNTRLLEEVYKTMPTLDFFRAVCDPLVSQLRVLPLPNVACWSDWGSTERVFASLQRIGKLEEALVQSQPHDLKPLVSDVSAPLTLI